MRPNLIWASLLGTLFFNSVSANGPSWRDDDSKNTNVGKFSNNHHEGDYGHQEDNHQDPLHLVGSNIVPAVVSNNVRHVTLTVSYGKVSPDGFLVDGILVNGQFPAPAIVAYEGETLQVTVVNRLGSGKPTTMHWHGLFQNGTQINDGVSFVTQCPIVDGHQYTYTMYLKQSGTFWYHSHYRTQYGEGQRGAIVILPKTYSKVQKGSHDALITLSDWYHGNGDVLFNNLFNLSSPINGIPPTPDSVLINGRGQGNCSSLVAANLEPNTTVCGSDLYSTLDFASDKKYWVRVINMAAFSGFVFQIPGVKLYVVETDGVETVPTPVDQIFIEPGQRVSFVVDAHTLSSGLFTMQALTQFRFAFPDVSLKAINLGYIRVDGSNTPAIQVPVNANDTLQLYGSGFVQNVNKTVVGWAPPTEGSVPEITDMTPSTRLLYEFQFANDNATGQRYNFASVYQYIDDEIVGLFGGSTWNPDNVTALEYAVAGAKSNNLVSPTNKANFPRGWNAIATPGGDVVELTWINILAPIPIDHPLHLHGHNFWVVGSGNLQVDATGQTILPTLADIESGITNLTKGATNTPLRDVATVNGGTWLTVRYVANNPGVWASHCHFDWHLNLGFAVYLVEAQEKLADLEFPHAWKQVCADARAQGVMPLGNTTRIGVNVTTF
ncbi:hypothetical protein SmJEL517_g04385 [Synchytrium microbalum]|uniref:Laccase n=1 Tax=Synchytrium microbalum TaxID=1806994 RepID=A0A507BZF6_9FUNG|nr:uncharacterized protein SmJEL517_g04385 [Synchytrium microbalum]TPX32511.1 hypothetical protein SmJEL517_g04385 [Synchytrium microbalum]